MGRNDRAGAPRAVAQTAHRHVLAAKLLETARSEYERSTGILPVAIGLDDDELHETYAAVG